VLRLFDPETDPEGLPIRKAFPRRMAYFAKGEVSQRVYAALRGAPRQPTSWPKRRWPRRRSPKMIGMSAATS
jgi:hypothetical protein